MTELKKNIEALAKEENKSELEIITLLQYCAARLKDENTLETLCKLKEDYIKC